jgi:hypothetical protein
MEIFTTGGLRARRPAFALALAGVVGLALPAAGCGGGGSTAKVAQVATASAKKSAGASNTPGSGDPTAYSACMRRNGVGNFPDPDSSGHILIPSGVSGNGQKTGVDTNSPQFKHAARACQKLQPNGSRPSAAQQAQAQQTRTRLADELSFAKCMRSRGVRRFPDPTAQGDLSAAMVEAQGIDVHSPAVLRVVQACLLASHGALTPAMVGKALNNAGR